MSAEAAFERLVDAAGTWHGTSTLQDPGRRAPETTASDLRVAAVLGARFVRLDYSWSYQGQPQEGSLLVGFDPEARLYSGHWIDTWHMSRKVMALQAVSESSGTMNLRGTYSVPPGPDWGWRIVIEVDALALRLVMFNMWPSGAREDLAVEANYSRATPAPIA